MGVLDGYKTYIGGACFILGAVATVGKSYYLGELIDWNVIILEIGTGISIIGGRSAFSKAHAN